MRFQLTPRGDLRHARPAYGLLAAGAVPACAVWRAPAPSTAHSGSVALSLAIAPLPLAASALVCVPSAQLTSSHLVYPAIVALT
jgi:hypothetical protein